MDVVDYYKLAKEEGLWAGIDSSATLDQVNFGRYHVCIDTVIGSACMRTVSNQVVEIAQQ